MSAGLLHGGGCGCADHFRSRLFVSCTLASLSHCVVLFRWLAFQHSSEPKDQCAPLAVLAQPTFCTVPPAQRLPEELNSSRQILPVGAEVHTMHRSSLHAGHIHTNKPLLFIETSIARERPRPWRPLLVLVLFLHFCFGLFFSPYCFYNF